MSKLPHLNRRLTLETPAVLDDGAGGYEPIWTVLGVHWAEVITRKGRETSGLSAPVSRTPVTITVRAAPHGDLARPRPEQRFRDGQRLFNIHAVRELDAQGLYLACDAQEEVIA